MLVHNRARGKADPRVECHVHQEAKLAPSCSQSLAEDRQLVAVSKLVPKIEGSLESVIVNQH